MKIGMHGSSSNLMISTKLKMTTNDAARDKTTSHWLVKPNGAPNAQTLTVIHSFIARSYHNVAWNHTNQLLTIMVFILYLLCLSLSLSLLTAFFLAIKHWNYYDGWLCVSVSVYMEMHFISPLAWQASPSPALTFHSMKRRWKKNHFIFSFMNDFVSLILRSLFYLIS